MISPFFIVVPVLCVVGVVACFACGLAQAAKEGDEFLPQLLEQHAEAAQEQADAFLDAVRDIAADCCKSVHDELDVLDECERIFALDAREPGIRR